MSTEKLSHFISDLSESTSQQKLCVTMKLTPDEKKFFYESHETADRVLKMWLRVAQIKSELNYLLCS
ncbi:CLUMA_CG005231, isoform A [Clunio marinus]|uniref:CLUMA_CG005231, isoform A n=1 Tax=Clunio marinus TaxID=568069 RepID=A0A1J1HZL7_9DIPT|nr:CLUMA_CG005231, isoform A [Clunio marinus]